MTTFARLTSGLSDVQTLSAYHVLRAEGRAAPAPSVQQWDEFMVQQREAITENTDFTPARRASLLARLGTAAAGDRPDGPSWFAVRNITNHTYRQREAISAELASVASDTGLSTESVRARFNELSESADTVGGPAPAGYTHLDAVQWRQHGFPQDRGTVQALTLMRGEAYTARQAAAVVDPPRVTREPVEHHFIDSMGYNPEGGRLEVTFARYPGRVYAYANVSESTWGRMNDRQNNSLGTVYGEVRNNTDHQYASQEESDRDATGYRCESCGQFRSVLAHACPTPAAPAPVVPPVSRTVPRRTRTVPEPVAEVVPEEAPYPAPLLPPLLAEPDPVVQVVPEPVVAAVVTEVPVTQTNRRMSRREGAYHPGTFRAPNLPQTRRGLRDGGIVRTTLAVQTPYVAPGREDAWPELGDEFFADRSNIYQSWVSGSIDLQRDEQGAIRVRARELACMCYPYRRNGHCGHVDLAIGEYERNLARIVDAAPGQRGANAVDPSVAQAAAETGLNQDWMRSETFAAEARTRWVPSAAADSYSDTFASFESDYQAALDRKEAGQAAVPYMTENATGGLCAPGGGRSFGVEIEFDINPGVDRYAALAAIGQQLHAEGLTNSPRQGYYHAGMSRGYTENHQGGWSYEQDCTVSGEIVSPIMYDTPETWTNLAKVCEIVKANGGTATARTGSHVHVSTGTYDHTPENHTELVRMVNQHEDVLFRVSQNPERSTHRPTRWCGPNSEVPPSGYTDIGTARMRNCSHNFALNMQSVQGRTSDHAEFRHWDGTIDPAAIQAQVKISAAMADAAQRNAGQHGVSQRGSERVGAHAARLQVVRGRSRRALTSEELESDTATARSLADTLFTRREDKAQFAALFAVTNWQRRSTR
ncbi:amidoligase family protein [Tessaracoccus sp.]